MFASVVNCKPKVDIVGYSLKQFNENLEGDKAVLIVAYYERYYEKECNLVSMLQSKGVKIYLKNHPIFPSSVYDDLKNKYDVTVLTGARFPKVDICFSYSSTLALEYEDLGVKTILYDNLRDEDIQQIVTDVCEEIHRN